MRIPSRFRKPLKIVGAIIGIVLLGSLIDQCWQVRRLSPGQFIHKAENISVISSATSTRYLGVEGDRVYLEYWMAGRSTEIRYWTSLNELPTDLAERLKAGDPPWKSPEDRRREEAAGE